MIAPYRTGGIISFARHPAPEVSILVLGFRRSDLLEHSLRALEGHATEYPFEVVLVLNGASSAVIQMVGERVRGVTVVSSTANLGFAGGCNRARAAARAPLLVLLNDDAEVQHGWLDALVTTIHRRPGIGAVGSAVLAPDGSVLEVGSVLWRDGSTLGIGRGRSPDDPDLGHLRQVDYASACSLMVPALEWDRVGGMDERYHPAYYEDVDLCLRLREAGLRVYVQPASRVLHHESSSLSPRYLALVSRVARDNFRKRWAAQLNMYPAAQPDNPDAVRLAALRAERFGRRVLVVDDDVPRTASGSGHGRMHDALVELADAGVGVAMHPVSPRDPGTNALKTLGVRLVPDLWAEVQSQRRPFDVVLVSRPHNYEHVATRLRSALPAVPIAYDAEALFHRRLRLEAALQPTAASAEAALRAEVVERKIAAEADHLLAISDHEAEVLADFAGDPSLVTVRAPFAWSVRSTGPPFGSRSGAVFVSGWLAGEGSPNADGMRWFADDVLPFALAELPWLEVRVTGADPPPSVARLASTAIRFVGEVDLDQLHDQARVAIVPLRVGAGVKLKVVDALCAGVPVVATSIGAEGLPAAAKAALDIEDDPAAFAHRLVRLLTDRRHWEERRSTMLALDGAGPPPPPLAEVLRSVRRRSVPAVASSG